MLRLYSRVLTFGIDSFKRDWLRLIAVLRQRTVLMFFMIPSFICSRLRREKLHRQGSSLLTGVLHVMFGSTYFSWLAVSSVKRSGCFPLNPKFIDHYEVQLTSWDSFKGYAMFSTLLLENGSQSLDQFCAFVQAHECIKLKDCETMCKFIHFNRLRRHGCSYCFGTDCSQ